MTKLVLAKVTRKGQMTIPRELRKALGIQAGDYVALRPLSGGVFMSKASVSSPVKAEDVLPHLVVPGSRHAGINSTERDKDLSTTIEDIKEEIYRESTGG
jgi:AbrB family looped-hinge helix DNA binding protein